MVDYGLIANQTRLKDYSLMKPYWLHTKLNPKRLSVRMNHWFSINALWGHWYPRSKGWRQQKQKNPKYRLFSIDYQKRSCCC